MRPGRLREIRIPLKGVRKVIAEAMTRSAFTAPHVTEWLSVDVTATMDAVARLKKDRAWADVRDEPIAVRGPRISVGRPQLSRHQCHLGRR